MKKIILFSLVIGSTCLAKTERKPSSSGPSKAMIYCAKGANKLKAMKNLSEQIGNKNSILVNMDAEGKTVINQMRVDQIVNVSAITFLDSKEAGYIPYPDEDATACVTITAK